MIAYKFINCVSYSHSVDIKHLREFCFIWNFVSRLEYLVFDLV